MSKSTKHSSRRSMKWAAGIVLALSASVVASSAAAGHRDGVWISSPGVYYQRYQPMLGAGINYGSAQVFVSVPLYGDYRGSHHYRGNHHRRRVISPRRHRGYIGNPGWHHGWRSHRNYRHDGRYYGRRHRW